MCQNVYGCRVVQRLLMYADDSTKANIIETVLGDVVANAVDTYSNYVIQHILVYGPADAKYVFCCIGVSLFSGSLCLFPEPTTNVRGGGLCSLLRELSLKSMILKS